jgi:hypothetical protein
LEVIDQWRPWRYSDPRAVAGNRETNTGASWRMAHEGGDKWFEVVMHIVSWGEVHRTQNGSSAVNDASKEDMTSIFEQMRCMGGLA